jgi:hypothetical protein
MLIYWTKRCKGRNNRAHLCDRCVVEYVLPTLEVVMTTWGTYKAIVS